jgi:conjugative relaxase-like TrwC/TraI family protein
MSYYTAAGEPPGQWAGKAAARLGLTGQVDPAVIERLYRQNIGFSGEVLARRRQSKAAAQREDAAVSAYLAEHPYASAVELAEVRTAARSKDPHCVPYFDLTVSAVKSVSVLHASYRVSARQARRRGDHSRAAELDKKAGDIEQALMDAAKAALEWLERHGTFTRTGHHSTNTGEWRDGDGLVASLFLHHISRDGDPQLHVHVPIFNLVQRGDHADEKWRTLDSKTLHKLRLAVAPIADRVAETRLSQLGYVMVPRLDGNGAEVGGVSQQVMDLFSSRSRALTPELKQMIRQYMDKHGKPPSKRTIWLLGQQAAQNTRRTKAEARRTVAGQTGTAEPSNAQRLDAWEAQAVREEVQALSAVHGQAEQFPRRAIPVLDESGKARGARIAVAEVQKHHATWTMAQLRFEIHRALPVMAPGADVEALITEVARLAISGRAGAEVVQVTAPDVADVTSLGVRQSDGGSIYRPPHEECWTTLPHLDVEEKILADAQTTVPQLVSETAARAAAERTSLNREQRAAVVKMLTADTMTTVLIAPAGAGKSHTVGEFARLWTTFTGRRVIGLSTSTNAARVLQQELDDAGAELAESYNIAEFLGKVEGSDELRRPIPLHENDVLVLDEATQASTADLAMIQEAAKQAGARLNPVGDTEQLGSPEAGGMLQLLAQEVPSAELHEVRRFDAQWEADASVRLRSGDFAAIAAYDTRGRIRGGDEETAYQRAAGGWLADHLQGKDVLLLAGSNAEAAELARQVQSRLAELGQVGAGKAALSDGNHAGVGDLIRARLNAEIDAGGQHLANRDTLKVTAIRGPEVTVRRQRQDATWTAPFKVPRSYLKSFAELAYAGNVHVAQGRTVDTTHLLVTDTLTRRSLYVGMTRGHQSNTAHVVTGNTAPWGKQPYEQARPESVIKSVMQRESDDLSAIEQIRQSQEWVGGTGHLLSLWSAAVRSRLTQEMDERIKVRLSESEASRYLREPSRSVLQHKLRQYQLARHDLNQLIDRITATPLTGARSISSVLHGRLEAIRLDGSPGEVTWAQRTPETAPDVAREVALSLDSRLRELGERAIAEPKPWLLKHLGVLNPNASPALREDYARRAGIAAGYREAAGISDPEQAISPEPHSASPELDTMREATIRALEITEDPYRAMTCGQLEAKVAEGDRAQALALPDVSGRLRLTAQAEADAWQQSADAEVRHDQVEAASAKALARQLGAEKARLEGIHAHYESWSGKTSEAREVAGRAQAELQRRGMQPEEPAQSLVEWNRQFENDLAAVDRAIAREQQAALDAKKPCPPERKTLEPSPDRGAGARRVIAELQRDGYRSHITTTEPQEAAEPGRQPALDHVPELENETEASGSSRPATISGQSEPKPHEEPADVGQPGNRAAWLDELQARADRAAQRIATDEAERQASAEYVARVERQVQAEPQPDWSADRDEAEIEL